MLILALDTTTRAGSCALARDGIVLREEASDASRPPAARLPADLMALLSNAGSTLDAVEAFAVATGPGSFTGLRIGIATMQGLAFATGKPLIGVSGFDALASIAAATLRYPSILAPWVDAWRGEVYAAVYERGREVIPSVVAEPTALLRQLDARMASDATANQITFIGDGAVAYREVILSTLGSRGQIAEPTVPLLAGAIARLAEAAAATGELPPPHAIRPLYVRRPDAMLARDRT
jgi:tRNA threonylcarbamoyladenosine biosynthesis protein TsaB